MQDNTYRVVNLDDLPKNATGKGGRKNAATVKAIDLVTNMVAALDADPTIPALADDFTDGMVAFANKGAKDGKAAATRAKNLIGRRFFDKGAFKDRAADYDYVVSTNLDDDPEADEVTEATFYLVRKDNAATTAAEATDTE